MLSQQFEPELREKNRMVDFDAAYDAVFYAFHSHTDADWAEAEMLKIARQDIVFLVRRVVAKQDQ